MPRRAAAAAEQDAQASVGGEVLLVSEVEDTSEAQTEQQGPGSQRRSGQCRSTAQVPEFLLSTLAGCGGRIGANAGVITQAYST